MNGVFCLIIVASLIFSLINSPETFLNAISSSCEKTVNLMLALISAYAIFMGLNELLKETKINEKLAKLLEKPVKKAFKVNAKTSEVISTNLIANALGLSGVATPLGIKAMKMLDDTGNESAKTLLTVISSTSIQLFPLSVIQLYTLNGGTNVGAVIIVSLLSTTVSTAVGIIFCKVFK
ncbi:MAG: hypothetical protein IKL82_02180 [Clostridia bacterium]|nr:hypothetical protein [Clostridia bacterium]